MSNPENILANYRTYSYHHVLVMCDNTKVAEELSNSTSLYDYLNLRQTTKPIVNTLDTGRYVVLINGMVDSDFIINEIKWQTILAPEPSSTSTKEQYGAIVTEGNMVISEPRGIDLFNVIGQACDKLQTDPSGIVFLLKTFFIGQKDVNQNSVDSIKNIKPFLFYLVDISAVFDNTGTLYTIDFVSITNGAAKLPQMVSGVDRISFFAYPPAAPTIGATLNKLAEKIQVAYNSYYNSLKKLADEQKTTLKGQPITYEIDCDDVYKNYALDQHIVQQTNTGKPGEAGPITTGQKTSIESAILSVFSSCKIIGDEAAGKSEKNKKYLPKIISTLYSEKGKDGTTLYKIIYKVRRLEIPVSTTEEIQKGANEAEFIADGRGIVFDYYFSGKNVDILDFNIQMNMGLVFFQTITTSSNLPNTQVGAKNAQSQELTTNQTGQTPTINNNKGIRSNSPITFSTLTKDPSNQNKQYPVASADFNSLLARHAALETLGINVKIIGNPVLLHNMVITPSEVLNGQNSNKTVENLNSDWTHIPALMKINIFMPDDTSNTSYTKRFWYQGWYNIISIENSFVDGLFTQTLEARSLPQESYLETVDKPVVNIDKSTK